MFSIFLIILGLGLFESISSLDNAIINAQVLQTMTARARRWFLFWGMLFAVIVMRGVLPWLIVFLAAPQLGPIGALTAGFSASKDVSHTLVNATPFLLLGGGVFLVFLFLDWLFLREKQFGFKAEKMIYHHAKTFYVVITLCFCLILFLASQKNSTLIIPAGIGLLIFFITHGLRAFAQRKEQQLLNMRGLQKQSTQANTSQTDFSKLLYLELIDAIFSVDGVIGSFAFTLSVPLIFFGNGLGAVILRQLTVGNVNRIKKYVYLENGAMYSVLFLGLSMVFRSFGYPIPEYISPLTTFICIGYFFFRSAR